MDTFKSLDYFQNVVEDSLKMCKYKKENNNTYTRVKNIEAVVTSWSGAIDTQYTADTHNQEIVANYLK